MDSSSVAEIFSVAERIQLSFLVGVNTIVFQEEVPALLEPQERKQKLRYSSARIAKLL